MNQAARSKRPQKIGVVVAKSGSKTIKVSVERFIMHAVYKRYIRQSKRYLVHDENEVCHVGDKVKIVESSPISARKRWRLSEILVRGEGARLAAEGADK